MNHRFIKYFFPFFATILLSTNLKDVSYSIKQNGIMVNLDYDQPIDDDDIIGWKSDRGWVYLTLLGVRAPKNKIAQQNYKGDVKKIVIDDFDESTQLAILIRKPVLGYDIINSKTSPSTIVFIHTEMKQSEVTYDDDLYRLETRTLWSSFTDDVLQDGPHKGVDLVSDNYDIEVAYTTIPFDKRKEFRKLAKKFGDAGDEDKYGYFNRRQHIQKIVLNSMYGVLGLPVFRFYDLDNAEATTKTGQSLIKFTKKLGNHFYNKELGTEKDYCIYIDTDSVFYSAVPLIEKRYPNQELSDVMKTQRINEIATEVQGFLNNSYHYFAKKFCNLDVHRFEIKQEIVAKAGLFIVKKRYGMKIISDNGVQVNKTMVKGLDTVRSNFAPLFRKLLSDVLDDILASVPKDKIDHRITRFKKNMKYNELDDISSPTGVKGIWKYMEKKDKENSSVFTTFKKGTPVHVKAAIAYNDLVKYFKQDKKYQFINNGDKIRWVYLKNNTLGLNAVAYKGHEDPPEIMEFINKNINHDKIYGQALTKKLQMFYDCLDWGKPVDEEQSIERFF